METGEAIDFGPGPKLAQLMDLRCAACRGSVSTYFCVECESYYCEQCKRSHTTNERHIQLIGRSKLSSERNTEKSVPRDSSTGKETSACIESLIGTEVDKPARANQKHRSMLSSTKMEVEHGSTVQDDEDEILSSGNEPVTLTKHSTQIMGDRGKTDIGSMKVVEDETVLVSDIVNKRLKRFAFYNEEFILVGHLTFETQPWGITKLRDYVYIITLPQEMAYREMHVIGTTMNFGRRVDLGMPCPVCAIVEENIIFVDTINVRFVTTDLTGGNTCETFSSEIRSKFSRPNFMLYSQNHKLIYVNDPDNGVFGIDMKQKLITFHYQSKTLLYPVEVTEDTQGNIIILGNESNNIHVVSKTCNLEYTVSLSELKLSGGPSCICYLKQKDQYLLCTSESFTVIMLQIRGPVQYKT